MRRAGLRALMVVAGLALVGFYLVVAYVGYRLLVVLWAGRPDPATTLAVLVVSTLVLGYLGYRVGTARLLAGIDARRLTRERAPETCRRFDGLRDRMAVGEPELLVARMAVPNALSVGGPDDGAVVLDRGLFRLLTADELESILAHELAHLESRDSLVQVLAYSATRTVVGLVLAVLAPVAFVAAGLLRGVALVRGRALAEPGSATERVRLAVESVVALLVVALTLLVRAHSRRREYAADDRAVAVTGRPLALARALLKIERAADPGWGLLASLSVRREDGPLVRLLSTHPATDDRVGRLLARTDADGVRWRRIPVE